MQQLIICRLLAMIVMLVLYGCSSPSSNVTLTATLGQCADGTTSAPYCAAITIQNNTQQPGAQTYINSYSFAINSVNVSVNGVSNVYYPGNSGGLNLDPNGCTSNGVKANSNCTFYIQIFQESQAVATSTPVQVSISYTTANDLPAVLQINNPQPQITTKPSTFGKILIYILWIMRVMCLPTMVFSRYLGYRYLHRHQPTK